MSESVFEFFFKYPPLLFRQGELALEHPWPLALAAVATAGLAVPLLLRYRSAGRRPRPGASRRLRSGLGALRVGALVVLLVCLFRPVLLVSTVVPRRNFVGVLLDDSRSMEVRDEDGRSRAEVLRARFGAPGDAAAGAGTAAGRVAADRRGAESLLPALEERFHVRTFRFAGDASRVAGAGALAFRGERTDLAGALDRARQELAGLPVSGLVVVTDGAHNGDGSLTDAILALRAASIPVHAVGLGRERVSPDLEVRRVELPREALHGSTLVADVVLAHAGLEGATVRLDVEDGGRIVGSREVTLGGDAEVPLQLQFTADERGARLLAFRARVEAEEAVRENNVRELLLDVRDERVKILYLEGAPRYELKFLRRAVAEDPNLQVVTLVRTAEGKFLRMDVDDADELAGGFPTTREELFSYAGLVLGSVEASFFTHDQLRMMADFVGQRGGGLLALGGPRSLAEGGYAGTPLADALPVSLDAAGGASAGGAATAGPTATGGAAGSASGAPGGGPREVVEVSVEPTPAGRRHPALRLGESAEASDERWTGLPPLTAVNRVGALKPGAVALLEGRDVDGRSRVVLAHQRFGRGRSIVVPVQDVWLWQMHADIPLEDRTHETLWRQLLRWLVSDVPGRVDVVADPEAAAPGETVTLRARVEDRRHLRVNGARVTAAVTGPTGGVTEVPLEWTVERDGEYEAPFTPEEEGVHRVRVVARRAPAGEPAGPAGEAPAEDVSEGTGWLRSGPAAREPFGAGRRTDLLRRVAEETGGRLYTAGDVGSLPEELRYTTAGDTVVERRELWDMPVLLLLLLGLVGVEWGLRRWQGLA